MFCFFTGPIVFIGYKSEHAILLANCFFIACGMTKNGVVPARAFLRHWFLMFYDCFFFDDQKERCPGGVWMLLHRCSDRVAGDSGIKINYIVMEV